MKAVFTRSKLVALTLAFLLVAVILPLACFGQTETGQISGTVKDPTGAVVAGAKVTIKSVNTGFTREAVTNSAGLYVVSSLHPDTYEVSVEATGFQKWGRQIQVAVGSENDGSAQLTVGAAATTVEVSAVGEAVAVNTENQTLSQIVTTTDLNRLPTDQDRNPYALVGSASGVSEDNQSLRGAGYAINGQRSSSTSILLDGAENVNLYSATIGQVVPLDSVQEFSVLTSNFGAEFGRASGGVVNVVTKSGTNQLHGSAYEFNRISHLSSNTYQNDASDVTKGVFTRNNFGFSLGGPVKKDKLFFFDNLEWLRVRSVAPALFSIVDGGASNLALLAPASQAFFTTYGSNLAAGTKILNTGSCNGGALLCDLVSTPVPSDSGGGLPENTWDEVGKVDFNLSAKTTITGRYAGYHEIDFVGSNADSPYAGYNTGISTFNQNYTFTISHVFAANLVDTAKVIYERLHVVEPLGTVPVSPTLYTAGTAATVFGQDLAFPGYLPTSPGEALPFGGPQNLYQFYDDVSWAKGKHQFKFGGQFVHVRDNRTFGAYEEAVEYLGTNLATGLANLASGNIYEFQAAISPQGEFPCVRDPETGAPVQTPACTLTLPVGPPDFERNYHYNDFAFYGQDSFKVTPRLTLNGGLRWEYYGVQHNANKALDSNFVLGSGSDIFDQIRNGSVQLSKNGGVFWHPNYHNFGPRIGFAWDVFGDGKTSLRGGYAIGYERNFGNVTFNAIQNPPAYGVILLTAGVDVPTLPVYTDNAGPLAGSGITKAFPPVSQRAINQHIKTAYAETYNLSIERQITRSSLFSVAYSGAHGLHGYDIANVNGGGYGGNYLGDGSPQGNPTYDPGNRLNLQYSNMNYRSDAGYSHYNSMAVSWRANDLWSKGLNLSTNYTWSHSTDNISSTFSDSNGGTASGAYSLGYLDAFNPSLNYGNSDYDIRQRFRVDASWELPWMKSGKGIAGQALGGWGMGANINVRSGSPFSIYDCSNASSTACPLYIAPTAIAHTGSATATTVCVNSSQVGCYTPNTFNYITLPNTGGVVNNLGDSISLPNCTGLLHQGCTYTQSGLPYPGRNDFYGPSYWNVNMNFFKNFKITERFGLQFRAEMYNIFNHSNTYVETENIDASSLIDGNGNPSPYIQAEKGGPYGFAGTSADERRNIQLGLKVTF
jgi:outer membrane receptor protein involved in Fe transport